MALILTYESDSSVDWLTFMVALFFSTFAVFIFNFPFGKLFLGDAGAYLLGALIPVGLIEYTFDNDYSPWFVLAMLIYPVSEVIISVVRKVFFRKCQLCNRMDCIFICLFTKKFQKKLASRRLG